MFDWYTRYYTAVHHSRANAIFNQRLAGRDLCQHDFIELEHLNQILELTRLRAGQQALDLGCGNGLIAEYLSDISGTRFTGIDFIPEAIRQARERTLAKRHRLDFRVMSIDQLDFPPETFDLLLSIDTLYFTDLVVTLAKMKRILKPGGKMAIFYSYGCQPWEPLETFSKENVELDRTPLARALQANGLAYHTIDYTKSDYEHARRKAALAEELKAAFETEGNLFLYENHAGEAAGVQRAFEAGAHARYFYLVKKEFGNKKPEKTVYE